MLEEEIEEGRGTLLDPFLTVSRPSELGGTDLIPHHHVSTLMVEFYMPLFLWHKMGKSGGTEGKGSGDGREDVLETRVVSRGDSVFRRGETDEEME